MCFNFCNRYLTHARARAPPPPHIHIVLVLQILSYKRPWIQHSMIHAENSMMDNWFDYTLA